MAEQNKESSMEEILSSIKRIIAEDKAIEIDNPAGRTDRGAKPALKAVPDVITDEAPADDGDEDEVLELTEELPEDEIASAKGVFGDRRKQDRLIDDKKLDSMRESLSALVAMESADAPAPTALGKETSLEDLTREMMRPMLKKWLDENLPDLVEELVAREIQRISQK